MARGLVHQIVLTRLMVGHTHEDIDAKFAQVWKFCRVLNCIVLYRYGSFVEY